jgi:hypothetical protein
LKEVENCFKILQNGAISIQTLICNILFGKMNYESSLDETTDFKTVGYSLRSFGFDFTLYSESRINPPRIVESRHFLGSTDTRRVLPILARLAG